MQREIARVALEQRELAKELWTEGYDVSTIESALDELQVTDTRERENTKVWFFYWTELSNHINREFGISLEGKSPIDYYEEGATE